MAIVKYNNYMPEKDVEDLIDNVDVNFLGDDKTEISVNYGVSPAQVTISEGSIIEVNGNRYRIEDADYTFAMANAGHNYITFDDTITPTFSSSATIGTFDPVKQGYYSGTTRILRYYIDQSGETALDLLENSRKGWNEISKQNVLDRIKVRMTTDIFGPYSAVVNFDTVDLDALSRWDSVNHRYTCVESGTYFIHLTINYVMAPLETGSFSCAIRKNANSDFYSGVITEYEGQDGIHPYILVELKKDDYIDVYVAADVHAAAIGSNPVQFGDVYLTIERIF